MDYDLLKDRLGYVTFATLHFDLLKDRLRSTYTTTSLDFDLVKDRLGHVIWLKDRLRPLWTLIY